MPDPGIVCWKGCWRYVFQRYHYKMKKSGSGVQLVVRDLLASDWRKHSPTMAVGPVVHTCYLPIMKQVGCELLGSFSKPVRECQWTEVNES